MWIYISTIAKTTIFPHKIKVGKSQNSNPTKYPQVIVEKNQKFAKFVILHNRIQISEKFSPIISKLAFFLKCHSNCSTNKRNCSHTIIKKQQLTAHTSIVKRYMAKCYKHAPFSSKRTIVVTGFRKSTNISAQNTKQTNLAYIVITTKTYQNGSFFSYKKQHFHRFIQLATTTRYEKTFNNDM